MSYVIAKNFLLRPAGPADSRPAANDRDEAVRTLARSNEPLTPVNEGSDSPDVFMQRRKQMLVDKATIAALKIMWQLAVLVPALVNLFFLLSDETQETEGADG